MEPPKKKKAKKSYGASAKPNYKPDKDFVDWTPPEGKLKYLLYITLKNMQTPFFARA